MSVIALTRIKHGGENGVIVIEEGSEVTTKELDKETLKGLAEIGAVANASSAAGRKALSGGASVDEAVELQAALEENEALKAQLAELQAKGPSEQK